MQLKQLALVYDIANDLALRPPPGCNNVFSDDNCMSVLIYVWGISNLCHPKDPTCVLIPPKSKLRPTEKDLSNIAGALATRFDVSITLVRKHLRSSQIEEWGGIRRVDSTAGDTMRTSLFGVSRGDARDATYVRVRYPLVAAPLDLD